MKMNVKIEKVEENDIEQIAEMGDAIYGKYYKGNHKEGLLSETNWDISVKLLLNSEIIGFYLFKDKNMEDYIIDNQDAIAGKKGIQGVGLGVLEKHRGNGYGKLLINKSIELFQDKYDYMWGFHDMALDNIHHWKKRRDIVMANVSGGYYVSYVSFK